MKKKYIVISFVSFIICAINAIFNCKFESYILAIIAFIIFLIYTIAYLADKRL